MLHMLMQILWGYLFSNGSIELLLFIISKSYLEEQSNSPHKMKSSTCLLSLAFAASADGFAILRISSRTSITARPSSEVLSDIDVMCIMNTASYCVEEHCPVDDNDALMNTLSDQEELLCQRVLNLDDTMEDFHIPPTSTAAQELQSRPAFVQKTSLLNDMDLMCMMNVAKYCQGEGGQEGQQCSVEDNEAILYTLSQQREAASSRVLDLAHNMASIIKSEGAPGRDMQSLLKSLRPTQSPDQLDMV